MTYDDAVVGAGIIGLAHAYHLASRGRKVVVLERHPRAQGASIRNFGMLWPIGQPAGRQRDLAMRSREIWREVLDRAGIWHDPAGSLHLAHADDEAAVLEEFGREACEHGFPCQMLSPIEATARSPHIRSDNLVAALWSPTEATVDPRVTLDLLPKWLRTALGVTFEFGAAITICEPPRLHAGSRAWIAERIWICGGDDLQTLYPDELGRADLVRCKLQMMRTQPMPWHLGPMLAGGLTLLHYRGFAHCRSLPAVRRRLEQERPDHLAHGVHVLVSQSSRGQLTLGDSHEYDEDIEPFDKASIEALILGALSELVDVPDMRIEERWHGTYVKHPAAAFVVLNPAPSVVAVTGVGGAGMTLSFGLADQVVRGELG
jgi:D-hydroxyproline dehydrogenase subunit beta